MFCANPPTVVRKRKLAGGGRPTTGAIRQRTRPIHDDGPTEAVSSDLRLDVHRGARFDGSGSFALLRGHY
jgi:hypothetical protein